MFGRARFDARRQTAQRLCICVKLQLGFVGDDANRLIERQARKLLCGARDDLVVDIGNVADIGDVVGAVDVAQQPKPLDRSQRDFGPPAVGRNENAPRPAGRASKNLDEENRRPQPAGCASR